MRISLLTPSLLLALLAPFALSEPRLEIEVQHYVQDCTQRTANGDTVSVHYRGTLASDGSEFDASYSRGRPMRFVLGAGRVIKGFVLIPAFIYCLHRSGGRGRS
jgi:FK506-binding protein 2